ncbi:Innexin [Aphelenchoides besseyi]|nr:Innexin [Aphelenchoides besseyi]
MTVKKHKESTFSLKSTRLDDHVDRLHYLTTTTLLTFFALLIGTKQTFGEPLYCLTPSNYIDSWHQYIHKYCYVTGTYHTGNGSIVDNRQPKQFVAYYQWIPYVLAIQAFACYIPHLMWLSFLSFANLDYKNPVQRCTDAQNKSDEERRLILTDIAIQVHSSRQLTSVAFPATYVYFAAKLLNICNLIAQLVFMSLFIGDGSWSWIINVLSSALYTDGWQSTGLFPRISFCDFTLNTLGDVHPRTVQCVLLINMLNEKAFIIIYAWHLCVLLVTILNLFCFISSILFSDQNVIKKLSTSFNEHHKTPNNQMVHLFVKQYLDLDTRLLLRFVGNHSGTLNRIQLTESLFHLFVLDEPTKKKTTTTTINVPLARYVAPPPTSTVLPSTAPNLSALPVDANKPPKEKKAEQKNEKKEDADNYEDVVLGDAPPPPAL